MKHSYDLRPSSTMTAETPKPAKSDLHLYTAGTPNGQKASCVLEELGLEYTVHKIDISKGEQKEEWYLEINRMLLLS